jgi:hypothetical protein
MRIFYLPKALACRALCASFTHTSHTTCS